MISTGTASGVEPSKTVHAVAFIPGFNSEDLRISTLPALGRCISAAPRVDRAAESKRAKLDFILENTCSHASSGYKKRSYIMTVSLDVREAAIGPPLSLTLTVCSLNSL